MVLPTVGLRSGRGRDLSLPHRTSLLPCFGPEGPAVDRLGSCVQRTGVVVGDALCHQPGSPSRGAEPGLARAPRAPWRRIQGGTLRRAGGASAAQGSQYLSPREVSAVFRLSSGAGPRCPRILEVTSLSSRRIKPREQPGGTVEPHTPRASVPLPGTSIVPKCS